jgi:nucleoside-diphosphate-sugar epimerase
VKGRKTHSNPHPASKSIQKMKTILGTGQLGLTIMDILLKENPNEKILLVNRNGNLDIPVPENVQVAAADVTDAIDMELIARRSEVIFSCTDVPYQLWANFYPATASALAYALEKTNTRLVFADNLYSYGNVKGAVMHEEMPHSAQTKKGRIRASVIQTLLHSGQEFCNRVAFVKSADFIGPRIHKGIFGTDFLKKLDQGKTILLFGKPYLKHTFTYIRDFATAMIRVGTATDAGGQIWHVPNAPAITPLEWVQLFEAETGKKARVLVLPKFIVRLSGLFDPLVKELYELAYQFEFPYLLNHEKYARRFDLHFTAPETIIHETMAWFQSTQQ